MAQAHSRLFRYRVAGIALASMLLAAGGCRQESTAQAQAGAKSAPSEPPRECNVVILLIDTLRADHVGVYGYSKPTSPNIDALAAEGVLFEDATSCAPWTLPSVTSLLLSQLPCEHGINVDGQRIHEQSDPLGARMQRAGYATASYFRNPYAGPMTGFDRGIDLSMAIQTQTNGGTIEPWLNEIGDKPFFIYIHNTEPHDAFMVPPRYFKKFGEVGRQARERFRMAASAYRRATRVDYSENRPVGTTDNSADQQKLINMMDDLHPQIEIMYDGGVLQADESVGSVVAQLQKRGVWDKTLFIVTADHGEEMAERGMWQHDQTVYQELMHVPLIMRLPGKEFAGTRIKEPVSLIDIVPTIADYLRRPEMAKDTRGESLLPLMRGERTARSGEMKIMSMRQNLKKFFRPNKEKRGDINIVVRQDKWKGIYNPEVQTFELYELSSDPGEKNDLSGKETARAQKMREFAATWLKACSSSAKPAAGGPEAVDEETLRRLEALGYVGGATMDDVQKSTEGDKQPASRPASNVDELDGGDIPEGDGSP